MTTKHLDARGKGEWDYDLRNDTLFFKIKDREYAKSLEFDDFVLDVDNEGFITGVQIFEASRVFKIDKERLRHLNTFEFSTKTEKNVITIQLIFQYSYRGRKIIERGQNLVRESVSPMNDSESLCTVPA